MTFPAAEVRIEFLDPADASGAMFPTGNLVDELEVPESVVTGGRLTATLINAGIPTMEDGKIVYPETPEFMAERFKRLAGSGANLLGGCCGTGPEHIRALREVLSA